MNICIRADGTGAWVCKSRRRMPAVLVMRRAVLIWRERLLAGLAAAVLLAAAGPAAAHHSFNAEYDNSWQLDLSGTVIGVAWTNPHVWLLLDVVGRRRELRQWSVQFGPPNALQARGLKKADLQPGGQVRIRGFRSKRGDDAVYSVQLTLSDGRVFRTGGVDCPTVSGDQLLGPGPAGFSAGPR